MPYTQPRDRQGVPPWASDFISLCSSLILYCQRTSEMPGYTAVGKPYHCRDFHQDSRHPCVPGVRDRVGIYKVC